MFNPSRDQARDFLFESWRKYRSHEMLTSLESITVALIAEHPEYHSLLETRDSYVDRDYAPEHGETNPFLHLSMHLAIREQVSMRCRALLRNRPMVLMYSISPASPSLRIALGVLATGNSFAVATLTPLSVACAERRTAASNSNGVEYLRSDLGSGVASARRRKNSWRSAGFMACLLM